MSLVGSETALIEGKQRTHAVCFRVSEEEFEALNRACVVEGARSLSDLVRTAVLRVTVDGLDAPSLRLVAQQINRRLDELQKEHEEIIRLIGAVARRDKSQEPTGEPEGQLILKARA